MTSIRIGPTVAYLRRDARRVPKTEKGKLSRDVRWLLFAARNGRQKAIEVFGYEPERYA